MSWFVGECNLNRNSYENSNNDLNNDLYFKYKGEEKNVMNIRYNENVYTVLLNGTIYNKDEIKVQLQDLGFEFNIEPDDIESNDIGSDIEVLLKGYIYFGKDIVKKLNGVFSFAIWNNNKKELFIARDKFGIKPLFYTVIDHTIIFSTKIKGILEYKNIDLILDKQGICELFGLRTSTHFWIYTI